MNFFISSKGRYHLVESMGKGASNGVKWANKGTGWEGERRGSVMFKAVDVWT